MCLLADSAEGHGSSHEMFHDVFYRFHLFNINGVSFVTEEVAQEEGGIFSIYHGGEFLELLVAAQPGGQLQGGDGFRIPSMPFSVFAEGEQSVMR